jgi:hypothetical protein
MIPGRAHTSANSTYVYYCLLLWYHISRNFRGDYKPDKPTTPYVFIRMRLKPVHSRTPIQHKRHGGENLNAQLSMSTTVSYRQAHQAHQIQSSIQRTSSVPCLRTTIDSSSNFSFFISLWVTVPWAHSRANARSPVSGTTPTALQGAEMKRAQNYGTTQSRGLHTSCRESTDKCSDVGGLILDFGVCPMRLWLILLRTDLRSELANCGNNMYIYLMDSACE